MSSGLFGHVTRWLSAYCDGVLSAPQASRVAAHVLACQRCHRELALVRTGSRLAARLQPAADDPPPADLPTWSDLGPLLDARPSPRAALWRWVPAAALAVVVSGAALGHRGPLPGAASASVPPLEEVAAAAHRGETPDLAGDQFLVRRWIAGEPVTLMVADAGGTAGPPARAKQVSHRIIDDLQVASWTRNDRRYVLVSRLAGDAACSICHTLL
jgi:anti-sigma factor RsiW